jgi:D-alanine-D-alanine ligase
MKITTGIFFGGKSTEHEVSVITGLQALAAIDKTKYNAVPVYITKDNIFYTGAAVGEIREYSDIPALLKKSKPVVAMNLSNKVALYEVGKKIDTRKPLTTLDVVIPCVHGTNVEDGVFQGFLQTLGVPYAGCDVMSSAAGMDKAVQKAILRQFAGIAVLDCVAFTANRYISDKSAVHAEIIDKIGVPAIVKPINLGSSIGIKVAASEDELGSAIEHALLFTDRVIAERAVANPREINCAVLGDRDSAQASECEEPIGSGGILDFDDKYRGTGKSGKSSSSKGGMASLKRKIPADITDEQRTFIRETAVKAFKTLGCGGVARIDFLLDGEEIYFNEINTIPGSLSFYLWEPLGMKYPELLDNLISLALKRAREQSAINYSFEGNILSNFKGGKG